MPNFGPGISRFKLVIYQHDNSRAVRYSFVNEEKKSESNAIAGLVRRIIYKEFNGKNKTAMLYDTKSTSDKPLHKWNNGIKEF